MVLMCPILQARMLALAVPFSQTARTLDEEDPTQIILIASTSG